MFHRFLRIFLVCSILGLVSVGSFAQPCADTQPQISGPIVVSNSQLGVVFSTPNIPGHTYAWTVTGGIIGSGANTNQISVNWGPVGTGTVSVTETNPALGCSATVSKTIAVQPLLISYFYYTNTSCYGDLLSFWDASVADPLKPIVNYAWDFGDAGTSNLQNPTHTYLPPYNVTYTVRLIITNSEGMRDTIYDAVYVNPDQYIPHPNFTSAVPPCLYTPVQFNSTLSTTPPGTGNIIHWAWNFGDPASGPSNLSTNQNPTHVFSAPGTYNVNLEITNDRYCINDTTISVTILPSLPDAQWSFSSPTCLNNPVFFTDASTFPAGRDIVTWVWNFGDASTPVTINAPASPNVTHVYPGLGPYFSKLTVINNIGCQDSLILKVALDPSPIANFKYQSACFGDSVAFINQTIQNSGPAISSYQWDFGDPASGFNTSTAVNPKHQFSAIGTYNVTLIAINTSGCPDTIVKQVIVFPIPPVEWTWNFGSQNNEVVFHIDSTVTPLPMIGNMVLWNFGDGTYGYGHNPSHIYPAANTYNVTLTVTDTIGCSNSITHPVGVPAIPVAFFSSTSPVCDGQPVCFTDLSSVPSPPFGWITQWIWNYGDGSPNDTINFPNVPNTCHTYATVDTFGVTLTVIDNNGFTSSYTANVIILPNPVANFMFTDACNNQVVQFTDLSTANGGGNIISWDWNFGDPGSGILNQSSLQNPPHVFSAGGTMYNVRLIIVNFNNCTDTIIKQVWVRPSPPVDFTFDTACINSVVHFDGNSGVTQIDSIATWSWDFGDGNPPSTDPITTAHLYVLPGLYDVTLTVTDIHGCMNTVTHTIEVHPLPVSNFYWNSPVCQGATVQFTDQSLIPPGFTGFISEWLWDFGDGNTQTVFLPASPNVQHTYTGPGTTFTVRLTVWSIDGCTSYIEKLVTLSPAPNANFDYTSTNCSDQTVNFTDLSQTNGGGNLSTWSWDFGDPGSGSSNFSNLQNPPHTYSAGGNYVVTLITTNVNNCVDTITKPITINIAPVAIFTADTACFNSPTSFSSLPSIPNAASIVSYTWDFGDGSPTSPQANPTHTYLTYGIKTVTLTIVNSNGCIHDTTMQVLVNPLPIAEFTFTTPNCQGATVQFTNLSTTVPGYLGPIVRWFWDFGDGATANIMAPGNPNVTHTFLGVALNHTVTLTVTTADSCVHQISHVVSSVPAPIAGFSFPAAPCWGQLVPFTDLTQPNGGGVITSWDWNFGDPLSGGNNVSFAQNPSHTFSGAGTFTVRLLVTNASNCTDTIWQDVTVGARPFSDFSADTACLTHATTFTSLATAPAGSIIATYFWEFGDGFTSTAQNPTYLYTSAQTYNVKLTVTTDKGCTKDTTKQVLVIAEPTAAFSYNSPACSGTTINFTDESSSPHGYVNTWYWDFGDGNNSGTITWPASPNVSHTYLTGGTYPVTLTITTSDGCTKTHTSQVVIISAPLANFSYGATLCSGNPPTTFTDLSQQNGGGTISSWAWDFGDPGSGTNNTSTLQNPAHSFTAGGSFDVTLIVTNATGCVDTVMQTITINGAPIAQFTSDTSCFGLATTFTDGSIPTSGTIVSWAWNFGDPGSGGNNTSTLQNPTHVFSNIGTYSVILVVTNSNGCVNDTVIPVTVNPRPMAMFQYTPACVGTATQFTDLSTAPGSTIISWLWDFGDGIGTSTLQNPSYTYTTGGQFAVKLKVTNLSNCVDSITLQVTARPQPIAAFMYTSFFCPAGQVNFQDESQGVGASIVDHLWTFEPGQTSNSVNPIHVFSVPGMTYPVTLMVTDNYGCMDTIVDSVDVKPGFSFTFTHDTVCFGYPTHFTTVNQAVGDTLYSTIWEFDDPASGAGNMSYLYNPVHTFTAPGVYMVKLKAWDSDNCVDTVYMPVTVYDLPKPAFAFISQPCDSVIHLVDSTSAGSGSVASWEWHFGDGSAPITILAPGTGDTSHIYSAIGQYQVLLIVTNTNGCTDSITKTVERYPCISAQFQAEPALMCTRLPIPFADSSKPVSKISQWQWIFDDGKDTTYTTYAPTITHEFTTYGIFNVKLIISAVVSGVNFLDSTVQTINIRPTPLPGYTVPNTCLNQVSLFTDTSETYGEPITSWNWVFGEPASGVNNTSILTDPTHKYGTPGTYDVQLIVENQYGCNDSITKPIRIYSLPTARFDNSVVCQGDPTYFYDLSTPSDTTLESWNWDFDVASLMLDKSTLQNPQYTYPNTGDYTVQLIVKDYNGCYDTVDSTVRVNVTPLSAFRIIDNVDGMTGKIQLENQTTGASSYYWNFGNGKTSEEMNPVATFTEDGTYTIELISLNEFNCSDTTFFKYEVLFKGLYVPNAFSPSSGNLSVLTFKPVGVNLKQYLVQVFDQMGHLMWESTALDSEGRPLEGWDGTFNGNPMPQGTYMWKINALFIDNSPWTGNNIGVNGDGKTIGSVSLIR